MPLGLAPAALAALSAHGTAVAGISEADFFLPAPDTHARQQLIDAELAKGRLALGEGQLLPALQHYTRALTLAPDSSEALNGVAVCYDRLGRFEVSRTYYEIALGIDPTSPILLNNYGYSLYLQGAQDQARRFLMLAVAVGDAEVQQRALRTLASIDTTPRPAPQLVQTAAPLAEQVPAAQIVRTSAHEVRLVLDQAPAAPDRMQLADGLPAQMAALSDRQAAMIRPVAALDAVDEAHIALADLVDARLIAAEQAQRQMQARRMLRPATPAVPVWMQAVIDLALVAAPQAEPDRAALANLFRPADAPTHARDPLWDAHQMVDFSQSVRPDAARRRHVAALANSISQPEQTDQSVRQEAEAADQPQRRHFDQPFQSDDAKLNDFADRMQHGSVRQVKAAQVARLQALLLRMQQA